MEEYVNELRTTSHKLTAIGCKVDGDWLVALLFMGLPSNYEPTIMSLEASGAALIPDSVKAKKLRDVKLKKGSASLCYDSAFQTRGRSSNRSREQQQARPEKRCFICDEPGHFAAMCPEKRTEKSNPAAWLSAMDDVRAGALYFDTGPSTERSLTSTPWERRTTVG